MKQLLVVALILALLLGLCVMGTVAAEDQWTATDLNPVPPADEHIKMHDGVNETTVAFRAVITGDWYGVAPYVGDYGNYGQDFTISVYAWAGSYEQTVAGEALRQGTVGDGDELGNTYRDFLFDAPLEKGDYLVVYHNATPVDWGIATWFCPSAAMGVAVFKNGEEVPDRSLATRIYVDAPAGGRGLRLGRGVRGLDVPLPPGYRPSAGSAGPGGRRPGQCPRHLRRSELELAGAAGGPQPRRVRPPGPYHPHLPKIGGTAAAVVPAQRIYTPWGDVLRGYCFGGIKGPWLRRR